MKRMLVLILAIAGLALAQPEPKQIAIAASPIDAGFMRMSQTVVQNAPYSAAIVNESTQTLADGNRIVQRSTGNIARDSQGRTRQDMPLPSIGNMSAANAPHIVFIQDPVAQMSYTLNLTDKTAHKMPPLPRDLPGGGPAFGAVATQAVAGGAISAQRVVVADSAAGAPAPSAVAGQVTTGIPRPMPAPEAMLFRTQIRDDAADVQTENLGTQNMQGVSVQGVRTTRTIPAGQVGNDLPIQIVTEVWTSPELQTVVYSKRSDPRLGEQTFQLMNIVRSEPDASLFTVPADFKLMDGPEGKGNVIFYRSNE
jgi:hypothetical protein